MFLMAMVGIFESLYLLSPISMLIFKAPAKHVSENHVCLSRLLYIICLHYQTDVSTEANSLNTDQATPVNLVCTDRPKDF